MDPAPALCPTAQLLESGEHLARRPAIDAIDACAQEICIVRPGTQNIQTVGKPGHTGGHAVPLAVEAGVTVVSERGDPHQCNTESASVERCALTSECRDLALGIGARSRR